MENLLITHLVLEEQNPLSSLKHSAAIARAIPY
jgi:hypothetical protein